MRFLCETTFPLPPFPLPERLIRRITGPGPVITALSRLVFEVGTFARNKFTGLKCQRGSVASPSWSSSLIKSPVPPPPEISYPIETELFYLELVADAKPRIAVSIISRAPCARVLQAKYRGFSLRVPPRGEIERSSGISGEAAAEANVRAVYVYSRCNI